jgi:hypothetical protein
MVGLAARFDGCNIDTIDNLIIDSKSINYRQQQQGVNFTIILLAPFSYTKVFFDSFSLVSFWLWQ